MESNQPNTTNPLLLHAAAYGDDEVVILLLRRGINVNQTANGVSFGISQNNITPLHIAANRGHNKVVELLLDKSDIQVNQVTNEGATPLWRT